MASDTISLGEVDLKYTEDFIKQLYVAELDRKDKILSSMAVVSSPFTILFAAVDYLINVVLDTFSDYISKAPEPAGHQAGSSCGRGRLRSQGV